MSPFKSYKYTGRSSTFSKSVLDGGVDTVGIAITSYTNAETWSTPTYNYMAFRTPGEFQITRSGKFDICMVGGGGGGGGNGPFGSAPSSQSGGGGGAGGFLQRYNVSFSKGIYTVIIGAGGANSENGSPTTVLNSTGIGFTAYGGGRGGSIAVEVANGGSGGGGSGIANLTFGLGDRITGTGTLIPTPLRSPQSQGNPGSVGGGNYGPLTPNIAGPAGGRAGGGGGAGQAAQMAASRSDGGIGGNGLAIFGGDVGITTTYGVDAPGPSGLGAGRYVAGGGAGGGVSPSPIGSSGGIGGGGPATPSGGALQNPGTPGTFATGGGGGGSGDATNSLGGNGGPGLVIIRWKKNPFFV